MMHLVIDSSAYRKDPQRRKAAFTTLERLAVADLVKVHVPHVVFREFSTQQETGYGAALKAIQDALRTLRSMPLSDDARAALGESGVGAEKARTALDGYAEAEFRAWADRLSATIRPIAAEHGQAVMEAYFVGTPPFKGPKNRPDIPDNFIWQTVLDICREFGEVSVVAGDKAFGTAAESQTGIAVYETLEEFIGSRGCQALVSKESTDRAGAHLSALLAGDQNSVQEAAEEALMDLLPGREVSSDDIPEDNHEATITSMEGLLSLGLDRDELQYFGAGVFTVPFAVRVEALLEYTIFMGDYYTLPDRKSAGIHVEPWNDHYYLAEEHYELVVEGTFAIDLGPAIEGGEVSEERVASLLAAATVRVDEITDISVAEEEWDAREEWEPTDRDEW